LSSRHKPAGGSVIESVQPAEEFVLTTPAIPNGSPGFDALFRDHYPRLVAMLTRMTGDRAQAEEIASDVFCKVSQRGPADLPWIYRVATNAGLDALRANARRRRREDAAGAESVRLASSGDALQEMLRRERRARVQAVLAGMKPREAQMLLLRAEGLAYRELAETLGIHAGSVGTMLARAEAEFERRFRARYGDDV
jgi:RNA polymerase sigma-70 factor (ECF subfamily)